MKHIAVIPGDGIGVDVTREAVKVLNRAQEVFDFNDSLRLERRKVPPGRGHLA